MLKNIYWFQQIVNKLYRQPRATYRKIKRFGGWFSYWKMLRGESEMRKRSKELPPIPSNSDGLPIYFLTGKMHIHQTLFCAYSLIKVATEKYQFFLIDDGTLSVKLMADISASMPGAIIITKEEIAKNLEKVISIRSYPKLRAKREVYQHIKKLTDIHTLYSSEFKLVLDSDMLFFADPIAMNNWLKKPSGCLHLHDCEQSYGYTTQLMSKLSMAEVPLLMNVGAIGLNSRQFNWSSIEAWVDVLEQKEGTSYFLEQAISAMIASNLERKALDGKNYIVNPQTYQHGDVLHHYVDLSKKFYYEKAWKMVYD